jgi:transcriptional regulator with XRE-family HTH domain
VNPPEIKSVREKLGLGQAEFAQLLGVHALTVSRWERGMLTPTPHQQAFIASFNRASTSEENIGSKVGALLVSAGVVVALYALLEAAFADKK